MTYLGAIFMFFKRLRAVAQAQKEFAALVEAGTDPHEAGDIVFDKVREGLDPATLAFIMALIQLLIEMWLKKQGTPNA